jgi:hypothetical protein
MCKGREERLLVVVVVVVMVVVAVGCRYHYDRFCFQPIESFSFPLIAFDQAQDVRRLALNHQPERDLYLHPVLHLHLHLLLVHRRHPVPPLAALHPEMHRSFVCTAARVPKLQRSLPCAAASTP